MIKHFIIYFFLITMSQALFGQFNVGYHQSNLPFVAVGYEFNERYRPELRIGTDVLLEGASAEAVFQYDIINKVNYELYAGLGVRYNLYNGIVVPIGFNFYPFPARNFGFHIELSPIIDRLSLIRGSLGIRYVFGE